jgi:hypothetical protein
MFSHFDAVQYFSISNKRVTFQVCSISSTRFSMSDPVVSIEDSDLPKVPHAHQSIIQKIIKRTVPEAFSCAKDSRAVLAKGRPFLIQASMLNYRLKGLTQVLASDPGSSGSHSMHSLHLPSHIHCKRIAQRTDQEKV